VRQEETEREQGHVGDAVLEPRADEGEEAPEDEHQAGDFVLGAHSHPDGQADEGIAKDAAEEELQGGSAHLRRGYRKYEIPRRSPAQDSRGRHRQREQRGAREIAGEARSPHPRDPTRRDRHRQTADGHYQVVTGEQLGAREDDEGERDPERGAHHRLRRRRPARLQGCPDGEDEDDAQAHVRTRQRRKHEVLARAVAKEGRLRPRRCCNDSDGFVFHRCSF
jgi:hypothetical protein